MAQFDVHRLVNGTLAVNCQNDLLDHLKTRLAVPLVPAHEAGNEVLRLHPVVDFDGEKYRFIADLATAVPIRDMGKCIGSVSEHEFDLKRALDILISGI